MEKEANHNKSECEERRDVADGVEIVDADIVMMHDKSEAFMEVMELPIHNEQEMVVNPPMFWCTSSVHGNGKVEHSICQLVRDCFGDLVKTVKDEDIRTIFKLCDGQIDRVFFTLHCLKRPEGVAAYLKILRAQTVEAGQ